MAKLLSITLSRPNHPADRVHVEVTRSKLEAIAYSVVNLVMKKNQDYADAWQRQGLNGALVRLADKLYRVENLADGRERLVQDENVLETLIDAVGYCLLGILYLQENGMIDKHGCHWPHDE